MSNGAPVLLRGSRDWVPGQSLGMIQARSCLCAAAVVTAKLQKQLTDKVVHLLADRSWSAGIPDNHQWCVHCILSWPSFLTSVSFRMLMLCIQRLRTQHILAFVVGCERPLSVLQKKVHKQLMLATHVCNSFAETGVP